MKKMSSARLAELVTANRKIANLTQQQLADCYRH